MMIVSPGTSFQTEAPSARNFLKLQESLIQKKAIFGPLAGLQENVREQLEASCLQLNFFAYCNLGAFLLEVGGLFTITIGGFRL